MSTHARKKILDGRRRYLACKKVSVEPWTVDVNPEDPMVYIMSLNLHRRHLTPSQRSMVAGRARKYYHQQVKERQKTKGGHSGQVNLPEAKGDARDQVGKLVGVSGTLVDHATKVLEKGRPELIKAVDDGRIRVTTATVLAHESPEVQREAVASPRRRRRYTSGPERTR